MALFTGMDINASGMSAQRLRMDVISENIANANTTRTKEGGPYVRKNVILQEKISHTNSVCRTKCTRMGLYKHFLPFTRFFFYDLMRRYFIKFFQPLVKKYSFVKFFLGEG